MGSGTISLPCSGFFSPFLHSTRSLSVSKECLALADGPASFTQDFTCPALLRVPAGNQFCYAYGVFTFFDRSFQTVLLPHDFALLALQPHISRDLCGLGSSLFARRYWGNHCLFSSPAVTKMFQFTAFALLAQSPLRWGFPIRISADQWLFAPPRGFSQLIASFVASWSQGILRAPLLSSLLQGRRLAARPVVSRSLQYVNVRLPLCVEALWK